jgi:hypothetical protein
MNSFSNESDSGATAARLTQAFSDERLLTLRSYDLHDGRSLVLATPVMTGDGEGGGISCHFLEHAFCSLFLLTPENDPRLLLWGDDLNGISDIESDDSSGQTVLSSSWSFYNYTEVALRELDLATGALSPIIVMELDMDHDFAHLQVNGSAGYLSLIVNGRTEKGRFLPDDISMYDASGTVLQAVDESVIMKIHEYARTSADIVTPVFLRPNRDRITRGMIDLELFGKPYDIDLAAGLLRPLETF